MIYFGHPRGMGLCCLGVFPHDDERIPQILVNPLAHGFPIVEVRSDALVPAGAVHSMPKFRSMIHANRLGVCSILNVFKKSAQSATEDGAPGAQASVPAGVPRERRRQECLRSQVGSCRPALKRKQSHLHAAFAIQLGKRLLQLVQLLAGLAMFALGG